MDSAVRKTTGRQATEEADTLNRTGTKLTTSPGPVHPPTHEHETPDLIMVNETSKRGRRQKKNRR